MKAALITSSNRKRPIYIVLHVSNIQIGEFTGKASAPVKIYAEKIFIEMETNEGIGSKTVSHHFRIPCKDLTECKASFVGSPLLLVAKPTPAGAAAICVKCKDYGKFLDPESQDLKKSSIVLVMNYKVIPRDTKADLIELFQNRFAEQLSWSELSLKEAQEFLGKKKDVVIPCEKSQSPPPPDAGSPSTLSPSTGSPSTRSPSTGSPVNLEQRKILTPKGKMHARKKLFTDESKSSPAKEPVSHCSGSKQTESGCQKEKNDSADSIIQTRSRRRKASEVPNMDKPETTGLEPVKLDILLHHTKMQSQITLLDQHSKEQRENLQQHQKLLEIERGKLQEMEAEKERHIGRMRDLEISYSTDRERLRVLENSVVEKDRILTQQAANLAMINNELERERVSVRQLQIELEQEREAGSHSRKVQSDLVRVRRALDEEKTVRDMREQQLREKETNLLEIQRTLSDEQQERLRLEEKLQQARNACTQLERSLESERLSSQSSQEDIQTKQNTIAEQFNLLQQEREEKRDLEERLRNLQLQVEEERNRRISTERELDEERVIVRQDRETLERERQQYEQRILESERTASESERRLRELQSAVSVAQEALAEYRRLEPRDWIIRREEVTLSENSLGVGAWGKVYGGTFRACQVAVKQIHDLILSPHNRRLFEREMSIASRCRHPHLLQFIGATNDDGSPLFITELLDTDLRRVLEQRALHQEEIICLALDVAKGLNYLHLNKPFPIIHRDISSSNVLLWRRDDCWRAKLSDYGAANFMRQYMTVNPGARIYAAPEALTSQQSPKADVYSYGLLLCEMCIRELPVPQQIQQQIGLVTNGVLRELIMRCVLADPEARPSVSEVITVLAQQSESIRAQGLVSLNGRTATL